MILLCDEDIGTRVARALTLVGHDARSVAGMGWGGREDVWWLEQAGRLNWLVFSANKKMLRVPVEREVIERYKVGIVFLNNGEEYSADVLWLLLVKWPKLEEFHDTLPRPFARFLSRTGAWSESYRGLRL